MLNSLITGDNNITNFADMWMQSDDFKRRNRNERFDIPITTFYVSMVYGFANHLPYSMDIEQEEYVPGDFINIQPDCQNEKRWYDNSDHKSFYEGMIHWGDTFRSGIVLQLCYIFQQMLLNNDDCSFLRKINKRNFDDLISVFQFKLDDKYKEDIITVLREYPDYYNRVVNSKNNCDRRNNLDFVFENITYKLGQRFGYGNILYPSEDVAMTVYCSHVTYYDGIDCVKKVIKEWQLLNVYNKKEDTGCKKRLHIPGLNK